VKVAIYSLTLLVLILVSSTSWAGCDSALEQTLIPYRGEVSSEDIAITFDFDCKESQLIESLELPYRDSHESMAQILGVLELLPFQFIDNSLDILRPYCRNEESWFGPFCMAGDVDSAELLTGRQDLMDKLPNAILLISQAVDQQKKFNLVDVLKPLFKMSHEGRRSQVLLASFLGLDDNGVQTSRLMANLLYKRDLENYSKLFPIFFQMGDLPAVEGEPDYTNHFGKLLFATRVGNARFPGLKKDQRKTYKAWAGVYFGCRMAILGHSRWSVGAEGYAMGYSYEIIKTKNALGKPMSELINALGNYHSKGQETGAMMKTGTLYGYDLCRI
jgi:hypothetical protein